MSSYLSQGYLSESERNSETGVWTHLLRFRRPMLLSLHHEDTPINITIMALHWQREEAEYTLYKQLWTRTILMK